MRFDVCLMNPPYHGENTGDSIYIDFIQKSLNNSDVLVAVSPIIGFFGHLENGSAANKNVNFHDTINTYKPYIEEVNSNIFDAGIKGGICISLFDKFNTPEKIKIVKTNGTTKLFDTQESIMYIDNEYLYDMWKKLSNYMLGTSDLGGYLNLKYPAYYVNNKSNTFDFTQDNVYNHLYYGKNNVNLTKFTIKREKTYDNKALYVYLYKPDASFNGVIYKKCVNGPISFSEKDMEIRMCYLKFNNKPEEIKKSKNVISYLQSDFCKLVLKLAGNVFHPYLKYDFMPWLDFSKSYTEEELFNMIGMKYDKEEIDKILND